MIEVHKFPVTKIDVVEAQIVADRRRHVQPSVSVSVWSGTFISKHILPVIRLKRADILPLRVTYFVTMPDLYPAAFANGLPISHKGILVPWYYLRGFGFGMVIIIDVVVWKRDVERILPRDKTYRRKFQSFFRNRSIRAAVTRNPTAIPRALLIRHGVAGGRLFAYPKYSGRNSDFPGVIARSGSATISYANS